MLFEISLILLVNMNLCSECVMVSLCEYPPRFHRVVAGGRWFGVLCLNAVYLNQDKFTITSIQQAKFVYHVLV